MEHVYDHSHAVAGHKWKVGCSFLVPFSLKLGIADTQYCGCPPEFLLKLHGGTFPDAGTVMVLNLDAVVAETRDKIV